MLYLTTHLFSFDSLRYLSKSDTIYNLKGAAGCSICDGSWKDIWVKYSGRREWPNKCRVFGCSNEAIVGAHIGINENQRCYILPMCNLCNLTEGIVMKVKAKSAAAPILKRDVPCCSNC